MASSSTYYYEKAKEAMAMATSVAASLMLARSLANELLPHEALDMLHSGLAGLRSRTTWRHTITIDQNEGWYTNNVFYAVKTYLASRMEATGTALALQRLRLSSADHDDEDQDKLVVGMEEGEEMPDVYDGTEFRWSLYTHRDPQGDSIVTTGRARKQYYELTFHKDHKEKALTQYVPFIVTTAKEIRNREMPLTIYMNEGSEWTEFNHYHPFTFDTLAMDRAPKQAIIDDLDKFIKRKDYYKRIGKAWKRGYLLYGPPGTGKSSLVAAMANHLRFDIYDLELTGVDNNSQLTKLLLGMSNKSILLIEDIDCTIEFKQRDSSDDSTPSIKDEKVTLSGLLNFVDGLWSTTGEERIIVFTTNYKDRLDPALLRPGRMDMHLYMGYCTVEAVRILINNYHSIDNPDTTDSSTDVDDDKLLADKKEIEALMTEIEELIVEVEVTPAEVAETLMRSEIPRVALLDLIELLKSKKDNKEDEDGDDAKKKYGDNSKEEKDGDDAKKDENDDSRDDE